MAWRDDYRPGAFRGVPFHLKTSSSTGGRRTVLNEYPLRDEPSTEDMGRRARQFSLTMTVIGPDYMAQRDRLIEALETAGPGTLMHPFRGELYVAVLGDYSCEESTEQGGLARISTTFVEAGTPPRPDSLVAQGFAGNAAADALQDTALAEFEDAFSVVGFASFVAESAIDVLQTATRYVLDAGGVLGGAGSFGQLYRRLTGSLQQLILSPGNLAAQLLGLVRGLSLGTSSPLQALRAQLSLLGIGRKAARPLVKAEQKTPARAQLEANQAAVYRLIERAALAEAARLTVSRPPSTPATGWAASSVSTGSSGGASNATTVAVATGGAGGTDLRIAIGAAGGAALHRVAGVAFDSRDQAVAFRARLLEELDRQQLAAAPEAYRPLARLATELVAEMNGRIAAPAPPLGVAGRSSQVAASALVGQPAGRVASLAPLAHVTPTTTLPALLLAHQLYGNARLVDDIVARNAISHPGFVPGGVELEVLKNG